MLDSGKRHLIIHQERSIGSIGSPLHARGRAIIITQIVLGLGTACILIVCMNPTM
jgi:hypothetical protein